MTTRDPLLDDLKLMFEHFEGPPNPLPARGRQATRRGLRRPRLTIALGLTALLMVASVAGAEQLDLFDGTPATDAVKAQIATESLGAPPALDPGIEADKAVVVTRLAVEKGTVTLYASPAKNADYSYCMGLSYSWLGGKVWLGCSGDAIPIDFGISFPRAGVSGFVHGRVNDARATSVRINAEDGSTKTITLIHGYFLAEIGANATPVSLQALDAGNAVIATQDVQPVVGIPTK